jgi:outer membrane scaffolding protein for murein synthesis (MipA/OmpV family)
LPDWLHLAGFSVIIQRQSFAIKLTTHSPRNPDCLLMTAPSPAKRRISSRFLVVAVLAVPAFSQAQTDSTPRPLWELGGVGLAAVQQAYPGSDQHISRGLAVPFVIYRGKFLRVDRDTVGLRAIKTPDFELDIGFAAAFGSSSNDIDARRGMPDLGTLVEFGPRLKWNLAGGPASGNLRAEFALRGVYDLSDGLSNRGVSFEPRLIYEGLAPAGWRYSTSLGAVVGNEKLGKAFYGVAPQYATASRAAYNADSGLIAWRLGLSASREVTPNLRLFGFVRLDSVAGAANKASPLVRQNSGGTVGVALVYTFAKSATMVTD